MEKISIQCAKCGKQEIGTIDELNAQKWAWFSNSQTRFFWCPNCAHMHRQEYAIACKSAREEKTEADKDPRRIEKLKARGVLTDGN